MLIFILLFLLIIYFIYIIFLRIFIVSNKKAFKTTSSLLEIFILPILFIEYKRYIKEEYYSKFRKLRNVFLFITFLIIFSLTSIFLYESRPSNIKKIDYVYKENYPFKDNEFVKNHVFLRDILRSVFGTKEWKTNIQTKSN